MKLQSIVAGVSSLLVISAADAQVTFTSLDQAKTFLSEKVRTVSQPGMKYGQEFGFDASKPGQVTFTNNATDDKGKSTVWQVNFYLEHVDVNRVMQVSESKALKLVVYTKGDQPLFRVVKNNGAPEYKPRFDIFLEDMQVARDAREAFIYIVKNSTYPVLTFASEAEAFQWLQTNINVSYSIDGTVYQNVLTVATDKSNKISISISETNAKGGQENKIYEFYMADFNEGSFRVTEMKNKLGLGLWTTNNTKAIKFTLNGVQGNFANRFELFLDDPKLVMDAIAAFRYLKTGKNVNVK